MSKKKPKQLPMVRWYQPLLLLRIGVRVLLAKVIGQIADNRELQAIDARDQTNRWDYRHEENELWLDFVADTGDGWAPSYSIASAAAQKTLTVDNTTLPRAKILLLGGDLVYPDPSLAAYQARMLAPYCSACAQSGMRRDDRGADVFAVPGNHDWYDGLHAFQDIFCHDDPVNPKWPMGLWNKPQSHSYFSLQLPGGWWLLAPDVQLDHRINPAQRRYFRSVITDMQPGDRVIVLAPYPHWSLREPNAYGDELRWLYDLCDSANARLRLVLTGDLHHYSRYSNPQSQDELQLVTAGGGGAFLHPTHTLTKDLSLEGLTPDGEKQQSFRQHKIYPGAAKSHALSFKNALFPALNWPLSLFVGFVYTMLAWVLETRQLVGTESVSQLFESVLIEHGGIGEIGKALNHVITMVPKSPEFAFVALLTALGLTAFNDNCNRRTRIMLGALHTLLHLVGFILTLCVAVTVTGWMYSHVAALSFSFFWFLSIMVLLGGGVGGAVIGLYLMLSLNVFGANMTNAFSSLRLTSYKNFVRIKIDDNGELTLYPLGIETPTGDTSKIQLIEPPVVLR